MLKRVKPPEHGVIVRTAAEGATEEELEADLRRLLDIWNDIQKKAKKGQAPTVLYEEPELTVRVVRDLFTDEEFKGLVTDSRRVYDKIDGVPAPRSHPTSRRRSRCTRARCRSSRSIGSSSRSTRRSTRRCGCRPAATCSSSAPRR